MLGLENLESRKASALIAALDEQEITVDEFGDAIRFLKSEALQVTSFVLSIRAHEYQCVPPRLRAARDLCSRLAARYRVLS
jgi:hypothetical protein